jgi:chemotaxis protein methyltransferase CheR
MKISSEGRQLRDEEVPYLDSADFRLLSRFIHNEYGLNVTETKKGMIEARLRKRLRKLGVSSFNSYCTYLFSPQGIRDELDCFLDEITTNKTEFFRQPDQFEYLGNYVIPLLYGSMTGFERPVRVWSAACASGEEPYSIAMVFRELSERFQGLKCLITGSDLSTAVLEKARVGVYTEDEAKPVPQAMLKRNFLRSRDHSQKLLRIVPELRSMVQLLRLNLVASDYGFNHLFDIIFCRNVVIYFDRPTQEKLLQRLCENLVHGGWLFTGNAETISGMDLPLVPKAPGIYRKQLNDDKY